MSEQPKLVEARWIGGYNGVTPDGAELVSGESTHMVNAGEAYQSDNWEPLEKVNPYADLTVDELTELAGQRGVELPDDAKKAQIVKALVADDDAKKDA